MKHLLLTTIAAVVLVGCGPSVDIHQAAKAGNIKAVKQHLDAGADVELKCVNCGGTVLGHAAEEGHKEIAELLIAEGADVNAKVVSGPKQGLTPLDAANEANHPEIADLLRKHGGKTGEKLKK
jgi:ankyrin repeat protein